MNWIQAAADCDRLNQPFVLVTVLETEGSTPRDDDAKMLITGDSSHDTIGGGQLEFQAIETARQLLSDPERHSFSKKFNLGKDLEQCCGGLITLLFECFPATGFQVVVLGAGHVGKAVVSILGQLPCQIKWVDSRADFFSETQSANTRTEQLISAEQTIENCAADSWYLVMTHSHVLDQQLVEAILTRADARFCGLIGSKSKAASFRSRLKRKGFAEDEIDGLTSPVGLPELKGKQPMEIAVSVVAQMMILNGLASD
ncbi:MAG: xanthine dehydrogenase accessory protein XdhC [Proteobacteria bacterium]|nr:xanthine dehydrogenase accessory protein XdhC [Pseudomonadota bacterium]